MRSQRMYKTCVGRAPEMENHFAGKSSEIFLIGIGSHEQLGHDWSSW